jgi:enoyl-CoA hydratase
VTVHIERDGPVTVVTIDRPERRNAVDQPTADALTSAFRAFDTDDAASVAVLTGAGGTFCAGADLKAMLDPDGDGLTMHDLAPHEGPLGPSRLLLGKPVLYCRRWGVPLVDGGTVRLPRLVGHSHALDLILTGRGVSGDEALRMGLANRLTDPGAALDAARALAHELARSPQDCLRHDRMSSYEQWGMPLDDALANEHEHGLRSVASPELRAGLQRYVDGAGRHGAGE